MDHLSDKEQIEMLKKWWNDYGKSILLAIIIGVGVGYGWRYYKEEKVISTREASRLFESMARFSRAGLDQKAGEQAGEILKRYPKTSYAIAAQFMLAKEAVGKKDYKVALESLNWVLAHSDSAWFSDLAYVREAKIYVQQHNKEAALKALNQVKGEVSSVVITRLKSEIDAV